MTNRTLFVLLLTICGPVFSQELPFVDIHVDKKPGQQTGPAVVLVNGKVRRILPRALQAWPVMDGRNALIIALAPKAKEGEYHLIYVDGATKKRRDLGVLPFASADLTAHKQSSGKSVFALSSTANGKPELVIADTNGIRGRLNGANAPQFGTDTLTFHSNQLGGTKTLPLNALLGQDMTAIYEVKTDGGKTQYVQFLQNGTSVLAESGGPFETGKWLTNGEEMIVTKKDGSQREWPRTSLVSVTGVPAGARLTIRLLQPLASESAKEGDPVQGVLISPATIDNAILLPQGSEFSGTIVAAHGVGWAIKHETAALTLEFNTVKLPDGSAVSVHTQLYQVENSRESVNNEGTIQGIRSTGTPGHSAESKIASVAALDPVAYLFTTTAATAALGFAEPEILYPAGTEVLVEFTAPLITSKTYPRAVPEFPGSEAEQAKLTRMVRNLPFRTATKGSNKPSDLTNLVLIGPPEGLRRAFKAAGWLAVDQLTAESTFMTLKTVGGNQVYNQAP
ncbi:MAG: LssY C-terminal domain-containing protein, partial [Acidobacteriaceae bacterium]|nr:LssY C-terminal domain-containing protein [Acidobacteriaceae bacterium]